MLANVEAVAQTRQISFVPQDVEVMVEDVNTINEQIAEIIENPLMRKEAITRNNQKINDALNVLNAIYGSDFLNEASDEEDMKLLSEHLKKANALLNSGLDSYGNLIEGFSLEGIDKDKLNDLMHETLSNPVSRARVIERSIGPGSVADSGIVDDMVVIDRLNLFIENLTDTFLKRYQDASQQTTDIYTAFADLNVAISEMISGAEVDSERNTIEMDMTGLKAAIDELRRKLTADDSEIVIALKAITFPLSPEGLAMAEDLAEGAGLTVEEGATGYFLKVDESALNNIQTAFDSLVDGNEVKDDPNKIRVPSGTLQAFQTAVESVNNRVSTDNQTLIERLRSVTNQQQQTTQLFSSLMKEMFEANKGFLNKVA